MSKRDALIFLKRLTEDAKLMSEVRAAGKKGIVRVCEKMGYSIELEELEAVSKEIKGVNGDLSDEQLELVVGGLSSDEIATWTEANIDKLNVVYQDFF